MDYKFICVDVGANSKQSDSGVFLNSNRAHQLERGALKVNSGNDFPRRDICVPHILVVDRGRPLKPYLMRPYPVRN